MMGGFGRVFVRISDRCPVKPSVFIESSDLRVTPG